MYYIWSALSDITPYNPLKVNRRFGGTYRLHLHCWNVIRGRNQREGRWQAKHYVCPHPIWNWNVEIFGTFCSISFEMALVILIHGLGNSATTLRSCSTAAVSWLFVWPRLSGPQRTALPDGLNRSGLHFFVDLTVPSYGAPLLTLI
jgi:hypothetical protein